MYTGQPGYEIADAANPWGRLDARAEANLPGPIASNCRGSSSSAVLRRRQMRSGQCEPGNRLVWFVGRWRDVVLPAKVMTWHPIVVRANIRGSN